MIEGILMAKSGIIRVPPGFQPQLFCFTIPSNKRTVQVTSLTINSNYGL